MVLTLCRRQCAQHAARQFLLYARQARKPPPQGKFDNHKFTHGHISCLQVTHHDRGNPNLDPEEDLAKNREFYRVQDVRPPYTYAALIRAVSAQEVSEVQRVF